MKRIAATVMAAALALSLAGCSGMALKGGVHGDGGDTEMPSTADRGSQEETLGLTLALGSASINCPSSWTIDETEGETTTKTATAEDASATAVISMTDFGAQLSEEEAQMALDGLVQGVADEDGVSMGDRQETSIDGVPCISFDWTVSGETATASMRAIAFAQGSAIYLCAVGHRDDSSKDLAERILSTLTIAASPAASPQAQAPEPAPELAPEPEPKAEEPKTTVSQDNALRTARDYLSFTAFSHDGLVEQLEFEGFSNEDAVWAADNCGADWMEQAEKTAASYLDLMGFSRSELIDQLVFEGYTQEQAEHGADSVGL